MRIFVCMFVSLSLIGCASWTQADREETGMDSLREYVRHIDDKTNKNWMRIRRIEKHLGIQCELDPECEPYRYGWTHLEEL